MFWYVFNGQSCQDLHSVLKGHPIQVQWPLKAGLKPRTLSCDPSEPYIGAEDDKWTSAPFAGCVCRCSMRFRS